MKNQFLPTTLSKSVISFNESANGGISVMTLNANAYLKRFIEKETDYLQYLDILKNVKKCQFTGSVCKYTVEEIENAKIKCNNYESIIYSNVPQKNRMYFSGTGGKRKTKVDEANIAEQKRMNAIIAEKSKQLGQLSWYRLSKKIDELRKNMEIHGIVVDDSFGDACTGHSYIDSDSIIEDYNNLCSFISEKINIPVSELKQMKTGTIRAILQDKLIPVYNHLKNEITQLKYTLGRVQNADVDECGISHLLYNICYKDGDLQSESNRRKFETILIYTNLHYVKSTAYSICMKLGMLHRYNDAFSYALTGLTVAVDKYIETVLENNEASTNFMIFAKKYITGYTKNGMCELSTNGMCSASSFSGMHGKLKTKHKEFRKYNPNIRDNEDIAVLFDSLKDSNDIFIENFNMNFESQFANDESSEGESYFANIVKETLTPEIITEAKHYHSLFMDTIKTVLNTHDKRGNRVFNKYDIKLFEMMYGFSFKTDIDTSKQKLKDEYTQVELCGELEKIYAEDGITKSFSAPLVASRMQSIEKRFKEIIRRNPDLKRRFESINKEYSEKPEYMKYLSAEREAMRMTFVENELPTVDEGVLHDPDKYNEMMQTLEYKRSSFTKAKFDDFSIKPSNNKMVGDDITMQVADIFENYSL